MAPGHGTTVPGRLTRVDVFAINLSRRRLEGWDFAVGVDDIFNEDPPLFIDHPMGFSTAHVARPQGRFWRVTLRRTW